MNLSTYYAEVQGRGALAEHLAPLWFADEQTFVTTGGDAGVVLAVRPQDPECMEQRTIDQLTYRVEQAMRIFDERSRLYQYLFRSRVTSVPHRLYGYAVIDAAIKARAEALRRAYQTEIYFVVLRTASAIKRQDFGFSVQRHVILEKQRVETVTAEALASAKSFAAECRDFLPMRILGQQEAFGMLRRLLNFGPQEPVRLNGQDRLGYRMGDSDVVGHRDHLEVGNRVVRILTLKDLPAQTVPNALGALAEVQGEFFICTEFQLLGQRESESKIKTVRRAEFHSRKPMSSTGAGLEDHGKLKAIGDLNKAQETMYDGKRLGSFALTAVVHDVDRAAVDRTIGDLVSAANTRDFRMTAETLNQIPALFAAVPGNQKFQFRDDLMIFNTSAADLAMCFGTDQGEMDNPHLRGEYLALMETRSKEVFGLNLHHQDVGHSLVIGRTGAGKSFALNFLITHAQKYEPYTLIFDMGGSFEALTKLFGGSYFKLEGGKQVNAMNPFACEPTPHNLDFLSLFVKVLLEQEGERLTPEEDLDVYCQIENLYVIPDATLHRLGILASSLYPRLEARLAKWVRGGQFGWVFDNEADNVSIARFQTFDFQGMAGYPAVLEPLLLYVLHRADEFILDPLTRTNLKLFFVDEAWVFLRNPRVRQYITEALKTWRKRNAAVVLSTQSIDELEKSEILDVILESCATRLFLANPDMNERLYAERFKLNSKEVELISKLKPKREMLVKKPDSAKVVALEVDRKSYWLFTSDAIDMQRRSEAFEKFGFEKGLEVLENG